MKTVSVLGSTGSIGTQTLEVIQNNPGRWRVNSLAAGRRVDALFQQIRDFSPDQVVVADEVSRSKLVQLLQSEGMDSNVSVAIGSAALTALALFAA